MDSSKIEFVECPTCKGSGWDDAKCDECNRCKGQREIVLYNGKEKSMKQLRMMAARDNEELFL